MIMPHSARRRGHQETPVIVFFVWLFCTLGMGLATVARDAERAKKAGEIVGQNERFWSLLRGCAWGTALFLALIAALFVWVAIYLWLENRERKRAQKENL